MTNATASESNTIDGRESSGPSDPPTTREVAAAALLAALSGLAAFLPFASTALLSGVVSHGPQGMESLLRTVLAATNIPVVAAVAGVAAFGLYRRAAWGRRLALVVATLLLIAPVAAALDGILLPNRGAWDEATETAVDGGLLDVIVYHLFLIAPGQQAFAAIPALVGGLVAIGLLTRPRRAPEAVTPDGLANPRRPGLAMALLYGLAIESTVPYLAWLVGYVQPVAAHDAPPIGGTSPDVGSGLLLAIASLGAAAAALVAARSIRSRSPIGPYVAPMASLVAGPWSAGWLAIVGIQRFAPFDGPEGASSSSIALGFALLLLALVAIVTPVTVTVSVFRRRAWFLPRGATTARRPGSRPGRFVRVTGTSAIALIAPVVIGAGAMIINPPPPPVPYDGLVFEERTYSHAAPLSVDLLPLTPAGTLTGWSESLEVADPAAYAIPGIGVERAVVVRAAPDGRGWTHGLFLATDTCCSIPPELCRHVPLEEPDVSVDPCGPTFSVYADGARYSMITGAGFVVAPSDLAPTGQKVEPEGSVDARVNLTVRAIRGVPLTEALALTVGNRVVLYRAEFRRTLSELCRYSPAAVAGAILAPEEFEKGFGDTDLRAPSGCELPFEIWLDGLGYNRDDAVQSFLAVPIDALTAIGQAEALDAEAKEGLAPVRAPFPATIDATAYRIAAVDPATAIAIVAGGRVIVFMPYPEENGLPLPAALCPYVRVGENPDTEHGEDIGCPA